MTCSLRPVCLVSGPWRFRGFLHCGFTRVHMISFKSRDCCQLWKVAPNVFFVGFAKKTWRDGAESAQAYFTSKELPSGLSQFLIFSLKSWRGKSCFSHVWQGIAFQVLQAAGLNLSSSFQGPFGPHWGQRLWQHCPCTVLTAAGNKQPPDTGCRQGTQVASDHQAEHTPIRTNHTRAGFWHEEVGGRVSFLLYWAGQRSNTENNRGHAERDEMIPFLQPRLTCVASGTHKPLVSGLHEVKYFPWSSIYILFW